MPGSPKRTLVAWTLAACALVGVVGCSDDDGADVRSVGDTTASDGSDSSGSDSSGSGTSGSDPSSPPGPATSEDEEAAAACEAPPDDEDTSVEVALADFELEADARAGAGDVVFTVRNDGATTHQLAVYRGSLERFDQASLDGAELVAEVEALPPGASCNQTIPLDAGTYTLVCLVPGHAEAGMASRLVVS
ncbi:MAG: hypothetical protein MUF83_06400 [Acidimicrobiales bacterium]|nr:hypothetical protein [Acidimicrobiales bacterium]